MYPKESASDFLQDLIFKVGEISRRGWFGGGTGKSLLGGKITPEDGGMAYFQGRTASFREGMFCWVVDE